jgi:uncharacterized caspase-like protein
LIGVSEYEPGFTPLPAATKDVEAMRRILENPELGGFDEVKALLNPDPVKMSEEIQAAFSSSRKTQDLVLLFFSGHGVRDERGNFYLATRITRKTQRGELVKGTAVAARFVHDIMNDCRSKRQVVILDCCYSGAFADGLLAKDDGSIDIRNQLGGEGRAVLASSTSTQYSFEQKGEELSIYTRYLTEGIETGAADRDNDGMVSVDELHEYAKEKVQKAVPAMKPEIITLSKQGYKIWLAKAPIKAPSAPSAPVAPSPVKKDVSSAPSTVKPPPATVSVPTSPETSLATPCDRQEYRDRQTLLDKVRNAWIKGVLEKSLHGQALIALGLEERLNAVDSPAALAWETPEQPRQTLPPGTRVIDQFDQLGTDRTLLILGEPGAGKTITLLELARDLIHRAQQDVSLPMPVVLNLSSWKGGRQTIVEWLVQELHSHYQVPKQNGSSWVKTGQLLLLLDGLDEVKGDIQYACIQALNQFRQEHGQAEIVVCSRIKDYEALKHPLRFSAAIYVQPLTEEQIQHYLATAGAKLAAVSTALQTDTQLQELAKSPLMLNIIAIAYQGMSIEDLPRMNLEEGRQHLFNAYIERMFSRRGGDKRYPKQKVMDWLIWLAQRMVQKSQTVFLIEGIQQNWLQTDAQKRRYRIAVRLIVGLLSGLYTGMLSGLFNYDSQMKYFQNYLICGLIAGLISGLISGLIPRLNSGIIIGMISALILGLIGRTYLHTIPLVDMAILGIIFGVISQRINYHQNIEPVDTIKWSWLEAKKMFKVGGICGLIAGAILATFGLIGSYDNFKFKLSNPYFNNLIKSFSGINQPNTNVNIYTILLGWLGLGLFVGLWIGLILGFKKELEVEKRTIPNQGIQRSIANAVKLFARVGLIGGLIQGLAWGIYRNYQQTFWWIYFGTNPFYGLICVLIVGLMVGLSTSLIGGDNSGLVCIQHLILRLILWQRGCIPWNYARFLDYASERIFLQKVGGGYIFIHRLLLEHFASMRFPNNRSASNL